VSVVISVRVKKEVKEELEKMGVNIAEEIRNFLEEMAWRMRVKKEVEKINKLLEKVKTSPEGFAVKSVREDRYESH